MDATETATGKALAGVKVLDLTQFEAGTLTTETLAFFGAEVVKIEEPTRGDQGRYATTDRPGVDAYYFIILNCNKRSLTLNLRDERGRDILRRMIPMADVFIENFAPGTIERLGFGYEAVRALNPGIIYTQIKGFASDSPYARYLAFDMIAQAMGGIMSLTGEEGGPPIKPGPTFGDTGTALPCVATILAALYQKARTGAGQRIEISMQDAMVNYLRTAYSNHLRLGHAPKRRGNHMEIGIVVSPSGLYPCRPFGPNDYCYIYTSRAHNKHWEQLLRAMGREDLVGDPRYATLEARGAHAAEVDRLITEWTGQHTKFEVLRMLGEAGVPVGAVQDTGELLEDRSMHRRGVFATVRHPVRGDVVVLGWPARMSASPVEVECAPLLGQHSAEILREWLGLDEGEVARLRDEKVL